MAIGKLWKGKYFVLPQAASFVDTDGLDTASTGSENRVALVGEFVGLVEPKTLKKVGSAATALGLIAPENASSKEARLASKLLFQPSKGYAGASEVYLVAANPATAGSGVIKNGAAADLINLTTYLYGSLANRVKLKMETASSGSGKKITVSFDGTEEVMDNIYRRGFSILYSNGVETCTVSVDQATGTFSTNSSLAGGGDDLTITFANCPTIANLADAVNSNEHYTFTVLDGSEDKLCTSLDTVVTQDCKTAAYTALMMVSEIIDTINMKCSYLAAELDSAATVYTLEANFGWTYMTSGANGTTTNSDWQDAFDACKELDLQIICTLSDDPDIHAIGDAHVVWMSGFNGKSERRHFTGGELQDWSAEADREDAIEALVAASKILNSDRTYLAGLGSKHYDEDGNVTLYPAYMTAAMYAGIAAGSTPVMPLTRKPLNCLGLEIELRPEEIDTLLEGRLMIPIADKELSTGYIVARQLSTCHWSDNLYNIEFSVGRGADHIAKRVRRKHATFVGREGTLALDQSIINATNAELEAALRDGYIRSYDPTKTQIRVENDTRYVDYSAVPILPVNFIFGTYHLEPVRFTIAL